MKLWKKGKITLIFVSILLLRTIFYYTANLCAKWAKKFREEYLNLWIEKINEKYKVIWDYRKIIYTWESLYKSLDRLWKWWINDKTKQFKLEKVWKDCFVYVSKLSSYFDNVRQTSSMHIYTRKNIYSGWICVDDINNCYFVVTEKGFLAYNTKYNCK